MSEEAFVRRFQFRPYEGRRQGRIWRIWSISRFNMIHQWQRSRVLKVLIFFIIFMLIIPNMFLFSGTEYLLETKTANEILEDHLWDTVRNFVRFQVLITAADETDFVWDTGYAIIMLIAIVMVGAGLISDDLKSKVSEIYDSKVDRIEYLAGKLGAIVIFGNFFYVFPCVVEWILLIVGIRGVEILPALPILLKVIVFTEILTLVLASAMLAFSSLTNRRLYAGLLTFMFFLSMTIVIPSLTPGLKSFQPIMYLDIFTVLSVLTFILSGETSVRYYTSDVTNVLLDLNGLAGVLVIPVIVSYILAGLLICSYKVLWRYSSI